MGTLGKIGLWIMAAAALRLLLQVVINLRREHGDE